MHHERLHCLAVSTGLGRSYGRSVMYTSVLDNLDCVLMGVSCCHGQWQEEDGIIVECLHIHSDDEGWTVGLVFLARSASPHETV